MKILKFKTNINCNGCIAKVTPFLNKAHDILKWDVDIANSQKTLTVETNNLREEEIIGSIRIVHFYII